jgi:cleavage and polyadenylation specificity factor subunit 4
VCQIYLTGFCPDGLNCPNGHPKYELPVMYSGPSEDQPTQQQQQQPQSYNNNNNTHHDDEHPKPYHNRPQQQQQHQQHHYQQQQGQGGQGGGQQQGTFRKLEDVTCYKCGQQGHYANRCQQGRPQQK